MTLRVVTALVVLWFAPGCKGGEPGPCNRDYWEKRPTWADSFSTSVHTSSSEPCTSFRDCKTSLHFCIRGECRAYCNKRFDPVTQTQPSPSDCPQGERCLSEFDGQGYQYPQGMCRNFTGPDTRDETESRHVEGGACIPDSWPTQAN